MSDLIFFFQEAIIGIRRSALMSFISMATIALSLIVFGVFMVFIINLQNMSSFLYTKLEMRAYLVADVSQKDQVRLRQRVANMPEVKEVELVGKDQAWKQFQKQYRSMNFKQWIDKNPLPDSLKIMLNESSNLQQTAAKIKQIEQVKKVAFLGDIMTRVHSVAKALNIFGVSLVILLTIATLLTIINTIHLTVIARTKEITIMQLVGATNAFIKWPFIIEGFLFGITGSILSIVVLKQILYVVESHWSVKKENPGRSQKGILICMKRH